MSHVEIVDGTDEGFIVRVDGVAKEVSRRQVMQWLLSTNNLELLIGGRAKLIGRAIFFDFVFVGGEFEDLVFSVPNYDYDEAYGADSDRVFRAMVEENGTHFLDLPTVRVRLAGLGHLGIEFIFLDGPLEGRSFSMSYVDVVRVLKVNGVASFDVNSRLAA